MILYLGNKLSAHGFSPTGVETLGPRLKELGYCVIAKSDKKNQWLRFMDMMSSVFIYRKLKPVVIIDTYSKAAFWYAWMSGMLCLLLNLKYIPVLRGGKLPGRIAQSPFFTRTLFKNSFMNVAVSGYLNEVFTKKNFRVTTIHNFIDLALYSFKQRKAAGPRILWVRSFHQMYNPELAIRVLYELKPAHPDAILCMVGPDKDGSLESCKQLSEQLNLDVKFTGLLSKEEWIRISENYDVFLNTTNADNMPVSVMEAMALGMIVVTTNVGGIPYLFSNETEGIMVSPNNVKEMTSAIRLIISDPALSENISYAARKKAEQWDWSCIAQEWKLIIDNASNS